jgi:type II secretion system protein I
MRFRSIGSPDMSPFGKVEYDRGAAGFTLVEVLCALAVSCLALVYLMQSLGGSQRAARHLEDQLGASVVARSILAQERQSFIAPTGSKAGDEGKYHWEVIVLPASSGLTTMPQGFALYRLVVSVSWYPGGLLQLETVKLGR